MKLSDLHTDQILTDRSGSLWRVTAVNLAKAKGEKTSFMANMLEPGTVNGASYIGGSFFESALVHFEPHVLALS